MLIAGVGYSFLRDWSIGPWLAADLKKREWPEGVDIEDWSFGPLDASQYLQYADPPYEQVIFFGAVDRGRVPGTVVRRDWQMSEMPDPETVQDHIGEGISGVISLDNLIWVCGAFKTLPERVVILEVQPGPDDSWGESYSPAGEEAVRKVVGYIEAEVGIGPPTAAAVQEDRQ